MDEDNARSGAKDAGDTTWWRENCHGGTEKQVCKLSVNSGRSGTQWGGVRRGTQLPCFLFELVLDLSEGEYSVFPWQLAVGNVCEIDLLSFLNYF